MASSIQFDEFVGSRRDSRELVLDNELGIQNFFRKLQEGVNETIHFVATAEAHARIVTENVEFPLLDTKLLDGIFEHAIDNDSVESATKNATKHRADHHITENILRASIGEHRRILQRHDGTNFERSIHEQIICNSPTHRSKFVSIDVGECSSAFRRNLFHASFESSIAFAQCKVERALNCAPSCPEILGSLQGAQPLYRKTARNKTTANETCNIN